MGEERRQVRDLTDLPGVGPTTAQKLVESGYSTIEAIAVATPHELSNAANIPLITAQKIIEAAREALDIRFKTALEVKRERMSVKKITTGSRNLDELLGGGVETKNITEFFGEFGTGKCVSKDTPIVYVNPDRASIRTMEELYMKYAEIYGEERLDGGFAVRAPGLKVIAYDGQGFRLAESPLIYREKVRKILEITTESGARIKLTMLHPLLVLSSRGLSWTRASQVSPGDYIAMPLKLAIAPQSPGIDGEDAYFLGLYAARGSRSPLSISLRDEALVPWLRSYIKRRLGFEPRVLRAPNKGSPARVLLGRPSEKILGVLARGEPGGMLVPGEVLQAPESIAEQFLAGYMEGAGYSARGSSVEIPARDKGLALGLVYLMARLGIRAALRGASKGSARYRITVTGEGVRRIQGLPFKSRKPKIPVAAPKSRRIPGVVALHLWRAYSRAFGGARGSLGRLSRGGSARPGEARRGPRLERVSGRKQLSEEALRDFELVFQEALRALRNAREKLGRGAEYLPEVYRELPFPARRVLAEKLGVSPSTAGRYLSGALPREPARRQRILDSLLEEIEERERVLEEALALIRAVRGLGWERVIEVREVEYGDYVYDVVVPGLHTFVGGESPVILHNTQVCHQLAVNVQLDEDHGGVGGKAVYIDTEGTFRWERIDQMSRGLGLDPDEIMENIYWIRAINSHHQMAVVDMLFEKMKNDNIKLVVVDSVTGHFRAEFPGRENLALRQQLLNRHLHQLLRLAEIFDAAVVITNQVMARPDVFYGDPTQAVGGHVLGHAPGVRVQLKKSRGNKRIARVVDAPHLPEGEAVFAITEFGIRDPE